MRMIGFFLSLLFYGIMSFQGHAQYLHYNKLGHRMYANYKIGDDIAFTLKATGDTYRGTILGFTDSTVVFKHYEFTPSEIESIYVDEKIASNYMFKYKWHRILLIAGIGYPAIQTLNYGNIDRSTALTSIAMLGSGLLIKWMLREKLPVNEKYTLSIIHSSSRLPRAPDPIIE